MLATISPQSLTRGFQLEQRDARSALDFLEQLDISTTIAATRPDRLAAEHDQLFERSRKIRFELEFTMPRRLPPREGLSAA
jgi:hypothetical protein